METTAALPWRELVQLFVFALFVYAVIEVLKDLKKVLKRHPPADSELKSGAWSRLLALGVAYLFCDAFDYGVIHRIVEVGQMARPTGRFLDYLGTAAVIAMGAAWVFDKLITLKTQYEAAQAQAKATIASTTKTTI